ncbi:MAG: RuBisCO accumulation factor 1, partial [Cyanobacteriota bacterium]
MKENQESQQSNEELSEDAAQALLTSLRRKEGNWADWGHACQQLQKAGYNAQTIFEATGFEPIQQNLVIVASQVYDSLLKAGISEAVQSYLLGPRSDVVYEFRILNQPQRVAAATLAMEKQLDVDGAHEVVKAIQEVSRLSKLPEGFTTHPGDMVAYQAWKRARAKKDLQERSRLIAQGLRFAASASAREQIEKLLSDFTVVPSQKAPLLPLYRLEAEEELPCIVPVAGSFPLTRKAIEAVETVKAIEPFRIAKFPSNTACVPIPGWQMVLKAQDPVAIVGESEQLPSLAGEQPEPVLVVIDRQMRQWDVNSYFLVAEGEEV